jgi:chemotaxis protein MotB
MNEEIYTSTEVTEEEGAPAWVVTFGDLMSLLLCFFVLMLSFSDMDRKKYKIVSGSLKNAFGIQRKVPTFESPKGQKMIAREFEQTIILTRIEDEIINQIKTELKSNIKSAEDLVDVKVSENQITIRLMGETTFDTGKAEIKPQFKQFLFKIGSILNKSPGEVIIAGHTDNVPLHGGRFRSNLGLSIARAGSVAEFLLQNTDIEPDRVSTMGLGEYRPLASNDTPEGRQKNRRVEIVITF